jgi:ribosome-binding factor A
MVRSTPDAQGRPIRLQRIGEQVRHALAEIIARGDLRDEIISRTIISVSEVRVTPDLRQATVFVKASNGDDDAVVKALGQHRGWLRGPTAGADFDLALQRWNGSSWVNVATGTTSTSSETVSFNGTVGYYRWRVYSYSGSGSYNFWMRRP